MIVSLSLVLYKKNKQTVKLNGCLCLMERIEFINIQALCHYSSNWHHNLNIYFDCFSVSLTQMCLFIHLNPKPDLYTIYGCKIIMYCFYIEKYFDNHKIYSCQYTMNLEQWQNTNSTAQKVEFMWNNWLCTKVVISHRGSIVLLTSGAHGSGFKRNLIDLFTLYISISI